MSLEHTCSSEPVVVAPPDQELQVRIQAEFAEMRGLKLTVPQAARLFHADVARCQRVLIQLVAAGMLSVDEGCFVLRQSGWPH
jgi:hypothetical protein